MQESILNSYAYRFLGLRHYAFVTLAIILPLSGCSWKSAPPERYDAVTAAQTALEAYDSDKDGLLSTQELKQSPALESALKRLDGDRNGSISGAEISQRIAAYDSQSDFIAIMVKLKTGGRPIEMATVTFEPEPFMGANFQSYTGVSSSSGVVNLIGKEKKTPGLPLGFYRITIKRDGGAETTHGCEIADDVPSVGRMNFAL